MKKIILTYGLIIGLIFISGALYMSYLLFYKNPEIESNDFLGYVVMIIIYSLIFFGVRNYRNDYLNGFITFKNAFQTGALITLTASTVYVVIWLVCYYSFLPDYIDRYTAYVLRHASTSDFETKKKMMQEFQIMYKNPLFVILITYAEILPVGIVVSLISSFLLKKEE